MVSIISLEILFSAVLIDLASILVPMMTPETTQFSVRIPPVHTKSPVIAKAKRLYYVLWVVILALTLAGGSIITFAAPGLAERPAAPIIFILSVLVLNAANFYIARGRLLSVKTAESWYQGLQQTVAADTRAHLKQHTVSLVWSLPGLIGIVAGIGIGSIRYASLPTHFAIHFASNGVANGYAHKSVWSVFGMLGIELFMWLVFFLTHANINRLPMRLDPASLDASRGRYRTLRQAIMKSLWVMLSMTNVGLTVGLLPIWGIGRNHVVALTAISFLMTFAGTVICIAWIFRAAQTGRKVSPEALHSTRVQIDDDKYWKGGVFYFNPSDPSLFVPKRFGIGFTVNFGRPSVFITIVIIIAALLLLGIITGKTLF
ncbi:DUF1648 domain-containing protein [Alicyclobacillus sp. SO9]|uniref:DUF1648 domain-containing protein n=1 Tax=Alicyclobacillus sp. SO9 TaxID=2665646 RepID=UPI0018E7D89B|nr:DUF5808 domain-containing protein [Alicyclobacillus sp. SO9]QQE79236.1 DUF1648 domain-containing protein [Alicyclobacillus sp. SO9]